MKNILIAIIVASASITQAQNSKQTSTSMTLPYASIPDAPNQYTAGTVVARVTDGLGFRYYWATDSLRSDDLIFKPNESARTTEETIDHIFQLTNILKNAVKGKANGGDTGLDKMTFEEKRAATLDNIKVASEVLRESTDEQLASYTIVFQRRDGSTSEYPFWNMLNGPLADAIWHVGQVVSFRRSSGNPFNSKVSVLNGKLRE